MSNSGHKALPKARYSLENRGAPSVLTLELTTQIKEMVKGGMINAEIIAKLGVTESTWYCWLSRNTHSITENIQLWRRDYLLDNAEQKLTKLSNSKNERIQLEAIKFAAERLGKKWYSTREEHKVIEDGEGTQLEPENKDRIDKLLQSTNEKIAPILSPISPSKDNANS